MTEKTANDYEAGSRRYALGFVTYICEDGTIYIFNRAFRAPRAFTDPVEAMAYGKSLQGQTFMRLTQGEKLLEEQRRPERHGDLGQIKINI